MKARGWGGWCEIAVKIFFLVFWWAYLLVFIVRISHAVSFRTPQFVATTGFEEEALFSIWKFAQGLPVYSDPHLIPFSASYFNWLFYLLYGTVAKFFLVTLHFQSKWLPVICHLVSLAFGIGASVLFFLVVRETEKGWRFWRVPFVIIWCAIPLINQLSTKWVLTARPDIAALAFEALGLLLFLRYLRTNFLSLLILSSIALYAAWSFKQVNVSVVGAAGLVLLLSRNWKALFLFSGVWFLLVAATLIGGGNAYRFAAFLSQNHCPLLFGNSVDYTWKALGENPFIPTFLAVMTYMGITQNRKLIAKPDELTLLLASGLAFLFATVLVSKTGADSNYFMPAGAWLTLWFVVWADRMRPWIFYTALILPAVLTVAEAVCVRLVEPQNVASHGSPSLPQNGKIANQLAYGAYLRQSDDLKQRKLAEELATLPGPVFVTNRYGNLPWIQPRPPNFVVAYSYYLDEEAGVNHERGGWEGLMKDGYFHTVVDDADKPGLIEPYLDRYELFLEADGWRYYRLKP